MNVLMKMQLAQSVLYAAIADFQQVFCQPALLEVCSSQFRLRKGSLYNAMACSLNTIFLQHERQESMRMHTPPAERAIHIS